MLMTLDFGRLFVVVIVCLSLDSFLLTCLLDVVVGYVVVEVQSVSLSSSWVQDLHYRSFCCNGDNQKGVSIK